MEKNYCLRVNQFSYQYHKYFRNLDDVKKWFIQCGVEEELITDDDQDNISLDNLEELLEDWDVEIYNEAFFVIGFNSCMIRLEEIEFEY